MEKVWIRHYQSGVPAEINPEAYQSLVDLFDQCTQRYAKLKAFTNMGSDISFKKLTTVVESFSAFLQQKLGLKKGDRVGIMLPNSLQYPVAMFGVLKAGGTVVNFNPLYTADEVAHQIKDSGANIMLVMANFASVLQEALQKVTVEHVIVTELGDLLSWPKGAIVNVVVNKVKKMIPTWDIPGFIPFKTVISQGRALKFLPVEVTNEDIAFFQYTGGTTGVAKGAMLTHRNMVANVEQASAWVKPALGEDQ